MKLTKEQVEKIGKLTGLKYCYCRFDEPNYVYEFWKLDLSDWTKNEIALVIRRGEITLNKKHYKLNSEINKIIYDRDMMFYKYLDEIKQEINNSCSGCNCCDDKIRIDVMEELLSRWESEIKDAKEQND